MIAELLRPDRILVAVKGDFPQVLEALFSRSSLAGRAAELTAALASRKANRYSYLTNYSGFALGFRVALAPVMVPKAPAADHQSPERPGR